MAPAGSSPIQTSSCLDAPPRTGCGAPGGALPEPTPPPGGRGRIPALDVARAVAVVAMVAGHTLDALLAATVREEPLLVAYWKARGLTAPIFMMASGWAVTVAIGRSRARGLAVPRGRLRRVLLLLAIGYALRWPGWGMDLLRAGDPAVWAHLLAFDALHTIALSLLAAALVLALPWSVREKALAFALLAILSVALGMSGSAPLSVDPAALPRPPLGMAVAQAVRGTSPFPLFPWAAHFFAGALVGLLAGDARGRRAVALAAVGGGMVLATFWTGVGTMPPGHPALVVFRTGAVLVLFAALAAVPAALASRLAPLGRASLGVYAIHVPLVYGWSTHDGLATRVGQTLGAGQALALAALVLAASLAFHHAVAAAARASRRAARLAWQRRGAAAAASGGLLGARRAD